MTYDDRRLATQLAGIFFELDVRHQGVNSGVIDSESGQAIYLFLEDGMVAGRTGRDRDAAISGELAFTVAVREGGRIHFEQHRPVLDPFAEDAIASLSEPDLITLTAIVAKPDGSQDHAMAKIAGSLKIMKGRLGPRSPLAAGEIGGRGNQGLGNQGLGNRDMGNLDRGPIQARSVH